MASTIPSKDEKTRKQNKALNIKVNTMKGRIFKARKNKKKLQMPLEVLKISVKTKTPSSLSTTPKNLSSLLKKTWLGLKRLSHSSRTVS